MRPLLKVLFVAAAVVISSGQAPSQKAADWIGQRVVTRVGTVLKADSKVVDNANLHTSAGGYKTSTWRIYRVERVSWPRLWLEAEDEYIAGWVPWVSVIRLDQAIDYYTRAIKAHPKDGGIFIDRGHIWREQGDLDRAIADFTEAIRIDPKDEVAYDSRATAWKLKRDFDKAIADRSEAIRISPRSAWLYTNRARDWEAIGSYSEAIADNNEAIRIDPKNDTAYNSLAWLLATCPDPKFRDGKRAVASATRANQLSQWKEPGYIDTLAAAAAETGDFASAIKHEEKALMRYKQEKDRESARERLELYQANQPYREWPAAR